jgi:hypothetical protein
MHEVRLVLHLHDLFQVPILVQELLSILDCAILLVFHDFNAQFREEVLIEFFEEFLFKLFWIQVFA